MISIFVVLTMLFNLANINSATAQAAPSEGALRPRWVPSKPAHTVIMAGQSRETIEVKFVEGSSFRLNRGKMVTLGNDNLPALQAVLKDYPLQSIARLFAQPEAEINAEKLALESATNKQMPDLNLWYRFTVSQGTDPEALINALNALPEVEIAYPAPLPAPPPSGISTLSRTSEALAQPLLVTPSFVAQQGYLNPAAGGIDAKYAWTLGGGTGNNVTIVDIEYSFNQTHEDLPTVQVIGGQLWNGFGNDHGTAVLGELVAKNNGLGVTGIAYGAVAKFSSPCYDSTCSSYNPANAINIARTNTTNGDVILIEQQISVCGIADYGPLEWTQSVYDAIKLATVAGRIVVEAAGNGNNADQGVNLDGAGCNNLFNRSVRDSGAIIVGAGASPNSSQTDRSKLGYSSYGSRVDVQGWGENVATTGYGHLQTGSGPNQWYTSFFSGTSSASPIVTGAAALLSSIAQQRSMPKTPAFIRSTLVSTGSPQQAVPGFPVSQAIGPRPNLKVAISKVGGVGFDSQFTTNAAGWTPLNGSWNITPSGLYHTPGLSNLSVSTMRGNNSSLTYTVKMKRTGCTGCGNFIYFRGSPNPLNSSGYWNNGYFFAYSNSGFFLIGKFTGGGFTTFINWTASTAVTANWNTLKVTANGTFIQFFINNTRVAFGNFSGFSTGKVGIGVYPNTSANNHLYVDWATLSTTAPASSPSSSGDGIFIEDVDGSINPDRIESPQMAP